MIYLTLSEVAFVVLGLSMLTVAFFGWVSQWSAKNAEKRSQHQRIICRLCLAVFQSPGRQAVVKCPECGGKTNRGGSKSLG